MPTVENLNDDLLEQLKETIRELRTDDLP
jgi:hypothetical protein